ncbi:MAG TPA: IS66 family transposase [Pirellulales bacterium]|jgi:transposase|nr:IS66 family transposase [Pirellulales bacterium]
MSTDATLLPDDLAACHALIGQFSATVDAQQRRVEQLEHYIAQLLRARYGPRSEKVDPAQLALFAENALPAAGALPEPEPLDEVVQAQRRRGKRQRLPADLPRQRVEHDLADEEKRCPGCGILRERIGSETSEQLEFVPANLHVVEHVRWKYACRACQEHVAIAPPAPKPIERGIPGPGLLAQLIVSKYGDHLPLYRLEDVFLRHGVELSRSTLCRWARLAADQLEPLYRLMVQRVRRSSVIHTDDTPVSVLDAQLPQTRTGRFWVYIGDAEHPYSVYDYTPSRKRDGPAEFLEGYRGYLAADAFSGYDGIYAGGNVQQVLCWAHARRKFYEARTAQPAAHQALTFIGRLYDIEREAKDCVPERRLKLRRARSLPILGQLRAWLSATGPMVLPKSPLGQAIGYVLSRWDGFIRYCEDGRLAIDNNVSERTLRPCAIGRKNWLFLGSDRGGRTAAILFSLVASAKRHELEPFAYLRDMLSRIGQSPADTLPELLPDAWLGQHPAAQRHRSR